jgi:hypothetical protein
VKITNTVTGMIETEMKAMNMATATDTDTTSRSSRPLRSHLNVWDESSKCGCADRLEMRSHAEGYGFLGPTSENMAP